MREANSEDIAHRKVRQEWWKRLLKFAIPSIVILAIILIIFFDIAALAVSFIFIVAAILFVVFTAGGGRQQHRTHSRSHYKGRFSGVGGVGQRPAPYNLGRPKDGSAASDSSSASPYANPETYEALVQMYHQPRGPAESTPKNQKGQQSQLGANISNVGIVVLLLAAALAIWLFG
ncbi:MAG: hypothetical protein R3313_03010 [Candidatus Saccharimonadales bacterium]|nr:hypothetical protein [Candidatus Saccharimonadales bacterium]